MHWLITIGITSFNLHDLEVDDAETAKNLVLSNEDNLKCFIAIYDAFQNFTLHINPFSDIRKLLTQPDTTVNCTWQACDVLTTSAVHGVMPDGELANCGRATKDGVNWVKNKDKHQMERYKALYQTPQEFGGCQGCQYFYACKGQCPGTAIDGDWRNKTAACDFWFGLISYINTDLMRKNIRTLDISQMKRLAEDFIAVKEEGNEEHLDTPHVDWHLDHNDGTQTPVYNLQELISNAQTKL
jgi:uncharacterized protein